MIKYIIFSVISFALGFFVREIIYCFEKKPKHKKVKPLSNQNFKKAMKDLEIK